MVLSWPQGTAVMKNFVAALLSAVLTSVVLGNAFYQKKQFYPAIVYLTKSNPSMAVIYFQFFTLVLFLSKIVRLIFFGELRAAEFEHLMERSWYAVTETCLMFTLFRDDFSPNFVALFLLLLFLKSFHWLAEDRVDYMERSPVIPFIFHIRVLSSVLLLGVIDVLFMKYAYNHTLDNGVSVQMVFGFEYGILLTIVLNIALKYTLHSIDLHRENPWEKKAIFLLYTELIMGLIKVSIYVFFVCLMVGGYTLPLFAFRPMYNSIRSFKKALRDVILSRQAIRNMNTLYPDATPEELAAVDNVCIICREDMRSASKKLPCNHIFHTACLTSWFQRQQTCPTCRLNILRDPSTQPPQRQETPPAPPPPPPQNPPHPSTRPQPPPDPANQYQWPPGFSGANPTNQFQWPPGFSGGNPIPEMRPEFIPSFPFTEPMPPQSVNLEEMSEEALRLMEEASRQGVNARLTCLNNIKKMLDASAVLMKQYNDAFQVANASRNSTATPTETSFKLSRGPSTSGASFSNLNLMDKSKFPSGPSTSSNLNVMDASKFPSGPSTSSASPSNLTFKDNLNDGASTSKDFSMKNLSEVASTTKDFREAGSGSAERHDKFADKPKL